MPRIARQSKRERCRARWNLIIGTTHNDDGFRFLPDSLGKRLDSCLIQRRHHHQELVAPNTTNCRAVWNMGLNRLGDPHDQPIPSWETEHIVGVLHPINVNVDNSQEAVAGLCPCNKLFPRNA